MIVVDDPCLFASRYYLDVDAGLLPDFEDDIRAAAGVAHGRGGACPQAVHIVDADQMPVCLHKPHEISSVSCPTPLLWQIRRSRDGAVPLTSGFLF